VPFRFAVLFRRVRRRGLGLDALIRHKLLHRVVVEDLLRTIRADDLDFVGCLVLEEGDAGPQARTCRRFGLEQRDERHTRAVVDDC